MFVSVQAGCRRHRKILHDLGTLCIMHLLYQVFATGRGNDYQSTKHVF